MSVPKLTLEFNDKVVRQFVIATLVWGVVGMLVGVLVASQLNFWQLNLGTSWLTCAPRSGARPGEAGPELLGEKGKGRGPHARARVPTYPTSYFFAAFGPGVITTGQPARMSTPCVVLPTSRS